MIMRALPAPATIEEVAAAAGVSRSTVSRVVNGSSAVSPAAVKAVTDAIAALGYVPNRAARSLALRRTRAIALVVPEDIGRFFGEPYFAAIVSGIHTAVKGSEYVLSMFIASEDADDKATSYFLSGNADGAIVISHHARDSYLDRISSTLPLVFGGRPGPGHDHGHYVDVDNIAGGRVATEHLIARGRRRIATITGSAVQPVTVDRLNGYRDALTAVGLAPDAVEDGDFSFDGAAAAMRRILARDQLPDAVFAQSDLMARGALSVMHAEGLRAPDDIAIVGFDDAPLAVAQEPTLTSVRQPSSEQGVRMAEILIELLSGADAPRETILPIELIVRDSS